MKLIKVIATVIIFATIDVALIKCTDLDLSFSIGMVAGIVVVQILESK